jgi:hypothetical protein
MAQTIVLSYHPTWASEENSKKTGTAAEIRTRHLSNKSIELYRYANLHGAKVCSFRARCEQVHSAGFLSDC